MLIQNTSNSAQAPLPIKLPSNGEHVGVVATPESPRVAAPATPSSAQLAHEVGKVNAALQQNSKNLELNISVDKATNRQVVKLTDKETGETLMQFPSEAVLAISRGIDEFQHGLLLRQKA